MKNMKPDKPTEIKLTSTKITRHKNHIIGITSFFIWILTVALFSIAAFIYGRERGEILQLVVFSAISVSGLVYTYIYGAAGRRFDYDNSDHPLRFFYLYLVSLLVSVIFPLMDEGAWAFVCIGVILSVFSEPFTGLASVSTLLLNTFILSGSKNTMSFIVYFSASLIAIMLFRHLDDNFSFASALLISMFSLFLFEICGFILLRNEEFSFEQFIVPIVNMVINGLILFGFLKFFNENVANKYRNKFLELNDQEYKVLAEMKEKNKKEYFRSIHTAYLVERMANTIENCDVNVAKNCAYYHRIKKVFDYSIDECNAFALENEFPPAAREKLLEYYEKSDKLISKETSIVYISDTMISTLMKLFDQNSKIEVDYDKVIDSLFEKDYFISTLDDSELTRKDYRNIKEIMKKEKLYYDFLR